MSNQTIQELVEQAGAKFPFGGFVNYDQFDCEKFAELIVQECVSLMEWQKISPKGDGAYNSALSLAQRNIKEHFGVNK